MIIEMLENATVAQIGEIIRRVEELGFKARPSRGASTLKVPRTSPSGPKSGTINKS